MANIIIEIKDEVTNELIDGYIQIGEYVSNTKNGKATFTLSNGTYFTRAIVEHYRGRNQQIEITKDTTIALEVTRG